MASWSRSRRFSILPSISSAVASLVTIAMLTPLFEGDCRAAGFGAVLPAGTIGDSRGPRLPRQRRRDSEVNLQRAAPALLDHHVELLALIVEDLQVLLAGVPEMAQQVPVPVESDFAGPDRSHEGFDDICHLLVLVCVKADHDVFPAAVPVIDEPLPIR